jgi:hypothetical protein
MIVPSTLASDVKIKGTVKKLACLINMRGRTAAWTCTVGFVSLDQCEGRVGQ